DVKTGAVQVLLPASRRGWKPRAVSPDGRRLALLAGTGPEGREHAQIHLLGLAGQVPREPEAIGPVMDGVSDLYWTPDGKGLVYTRQLQPQPPDHWETAGTFWNNARDIFLLTLDDRRERRLSRGGGFVALGVSKDGNLYYQTWTTGEPPVL